MRNEAHRFAVTFQRKQRQIATLQTELTEIPGVGPATAQKLMKAFGSVKRISLAAEDALAEIAGKAAARRVVQHFRGLRAEAEPTPALDASPAGTPAAPGA